MKLIYIAVFTFVLSISNKQTSAHKQLPLVTMLQNLVNNQDFLSLNEFDQLLLLVYTTKLILKKSYDSNHINISII